jgi:hypothetical protein
MLRHSSSLWALLLFGAMTAPVGLWLWHRQGPHFGLGPARGQVSTAAAYGCMAALVVLIVLGWAVDGE